MMTCGQFYNGRPKELIILLEARLIPSKKFIQVMKQHSVEDRLFGVPKAIVSNYDRRMASRKGPLLWGQPLFLKRGKESPSGKQIPSHKLST